MMFGVWGLGLNVKRLGFGVWRLGLERTTIQHLESGVQYDYFLKHLTINTKRQTPNYLLNYPFLTGGAITDPHLLQVRLCSSE